MDKGRLVAGNRSPEIPGGSGPQSRRGVSGGLAILRTLRAGRRPRQAPTFAHVAG